MCRSEFGVTCLVFLVQQFHVESTTRKIVFCSDGPVPDTAVHSESVEQRSGA